MNIRKIKQTTKMRVFISYRRSDSQATTDRLHDRLSKALGHRNVFKDVDSMKGGEVVLEKIHSSIGQSNAVLLVIGNEWLVCGPKSGLPRLFESRDYVRYEVETAIQLGKPIIPILVSDAEFPQAECLPQEIQSITNLNALRLRHDPDFGKDTERMLQHIQSYSPLESRVLVILKRFGIGLVLVGIALIAGRLLNVAGNVVSNEKREEIANASETLRTDLVFGLGESVTLEGKFFHQKVYTSSEDSVYRGRTAFLPIILSDRMLIFSLTNLDRGFLPSEEYPSPSDRIELEFTDVGMRAKHESAIGKRGKVWGVLMLDMDNRLLPVKFFVHRLEVVE